MPIIIENLSHKYQGGNINEQTAINNVNLRVNDGEFLGIIGHTGSGKSTLIQHLNGLLQPTSGKVVVDGLDLSEKKNLKKARSLVGMVFQYPEYQLFEETVEKDVAFGVLNMGIPQDEARQRAHEAMRLVGLPPEIFAQKSPFELSGGERRRAALAGIIVMKPKYLVLDEPMAGLDPLGRHAILDIIDNLRNELKCSVVMVSHSMDDMADRAERIAVLSRGEIIKTGSKADIFSNGELLLSVGLDLPQAAQLNMALKARGIDLPGTIYDMDSLEHAILARLAKKGGAK